MIKGINKAHERVSAKNTVEMEKLLQICNMFHCNMDILMQGDVSKVFTEDTYGYDRQKNQFSIWVTAGIGLSEELASAVFFVLLIISVMIFVVMGMQMQRFTEKHPVIEDFYTEEEKDQAYKKYTVRIAVGVSILVYTGLQKEKYDIKEYNKEASPSPEVKKNKFF